MKMVKRILSLFIVCAMLTVSVVALPTGITADPWTRSVIQNDPYGVLFYNGFEEQLNAVYGTPSSGTYGIFDFGMSTWGQRNGGKDKWYNVVADEINPTYRGNALEAHDLYGSQEVETAASFGANAISGKKLNISFEVRKDRDADTTSVLARYLVYVQLYTGDDGTFNDANIIAGKSGHNTRKKRFIELMTDVPNGDDANGGAGSMFNGLFQGLANSSAKEIGLNDTDWHQIDGVIDVSEGAANAVVKLFVDGTQVYTREGDFITDNAFDAEGNFVFNAVKLSTQSETTCWGWLDNFKITNTEGSSFGVTNLKEVADEIYLELSNTIAAGQAAPAIMLKKVGTSTFVAPEVSFEGSQAIKLDLSDVTLDANSEYQIVYPNDISLVDINGRSIDKAQVLSIYNDGAGNGATSARLVNESGVKLVPDGSAMTNIAGLEITFEDELANPVYEFTADGDEVTVSASNVGSTYTLSWDALSAESYNLTIKDDETVVYSYAKANIAEINPIIPDNSYGIVWSNDFEFDTSGYDYSTNGQQLDFGGGMITKTSGSSATRQRLEDMGDDYHKQVFTSDHIYTSGVHGTKTFDSDISGQVFNFSTQVKMNAFDISRLFNALRINLYKDGTQLAAGLGTGDDALLNLYYDTTATDGGWMHSTASIFSRIYGGTGGDVYRSGTAIGLDDTDWHQIDVEVNAIDKTIKFFLDGAQVGSTNTRSLAESANLLDVNGNFTFDAVEMIVRQDMNVSDEYLYSYIDNFILTKIDYSASKFGVRQVKVGTDAVYAELSATAAAGQTAPQVTLRKVGTDTVITPSAVTFEGSQALKIAATGLEADTEYEIVYSEGMTLTDINGRSIDKAQVVTFYNDGAGSGVTSARLVNLDNTLSAPVAAPANSIKGIMLTLEDACTNLSATLESASGTVLTNVTGSGDEWIVGWSEFLANTEHTLTVAADGVTVFTYVFTPELGDELSISEFALYDADGNVIRAWSDVAPGETLTARATIINPTGEDQYATLLYAIYGNGYLKSVQCDQNEGNAPIGSSFTGDKLEVEVPVPATGCDEISIFLWEGIGSMKPLMDKIEIAE